MSIPIIDTIFRSNIYMLSQENDTILVRGSEILDGTFSAGLSSDYVISIIPGSIYKVNDSLLMTGEQMVQSLPPIEEPTFYGVMAWGAVLFGMVIGWNLYFINEHREKSAVSINDLLLIVTALANGVLLSFFDNSGRLLGWYGVGLGLGFLLFGVYLIILANLGDRSKSGPASSLYRMHIGQVANE